VAVKVIRRRSDADDEVWVHSFVSCFDVPKRLSIEGSESVERDRHLEENAP
jgi:hypothetical protein